MERNPYRFAELDILRGIAISMVVIFHLFFDLDYLGIIENGMYEGAWLIFQRTAATLFVLAAGISIVLSESRNREGYLHHARRALFLGIIALVITVATWIYPHDGFIIFGILHFLALSILIAPLFFRFRAWNALIALFVIAAGFSLWQVDSPYLVWLGLTYPGFYTLDYFPLLPWFGVFLVGVSIAYGLYSNNTRRFDLKINEKNTLVRFLSYLGRNTLLIYLVHQPVIIAILLLIR